VKKETVVEEVKQKKEKKKE